MAESLPLVSLIIATYNHKKFVRETVAGALSQDYSNLEIVISDDCSPDGTFEILQDLTRGYSGHHKLTVRKNDRNLGLVLHVNKLLSEFAHGEYVMLSGGDDVCLAQTVSFAVKKITDLGVDSIAFNSYLIDAESNRTGTRLPMDRPDEVYTIKDFLARDFRTNGACRLFKAEILSTFGQFMPDCQTEDSTNLFRTFLFGKVGYCYAPNINYREHGNNVSGFTSLMTKFDPQKICNQYQRDLELALGKGMVSPAEYEAIKVMQQNYLRANVAIRRVYKKKLFVLRLICAFSYFLKSGYSLSHVKSLVKSVFKWRQEGI